MPQPRKPSKPRKSRPRRPVRAAGDDLGRPVRAAGGSLGRPVRAAGGSLGRPVRAAGGSLGRTVTHPADRTDDRRSLFDQFSQVASFVASSPLFFGLCAAVVAVWTVGLALGASDRFLTATAGLMSAITLMLVALLKNAELRADRALQTKLDAIAASLLEDRRGHRGDAEGELERSIGVHEEI